MNKKVCHKDGDFRPKEGERETGPKRGRLPLKAGDLTGLPFGCQGVVF